MRLLQRNSTGWLSLTEDLNGDGIPEYAILSHTWGADIEEVTFEDIINGTGEDKPGYEKIQFCGEQAQRDGLQYFWVDTCCINKRNYAELSHSINSMFRWYCNATRCYVYLSDLSISTFDSNNEYNPQLWESDFRKCTWFTRGWTLQELLAPSSVDFFSCEFKRVGNKSSLEHQIHEITGIPKLALQGARLSQFSDKERFSWIQPRETKLEEDKAYSLFGIFDVHIPLRYGEGMTTAFKRLEEEIDKLNKCLQDLRLTDPRDDKKRIEDTKGGLLEGSYRWILENSDFQQWRNNQQSRLLWIKADPGKGKTMLLCGITNELERSMAKSVFLSYFFCQATDSRINSATAVLRGLIYLLVDQQPSFISHVRAKYDQAGKTLFEDMNAWVALSGIFTNILRDPSLDSTYLIVDALDECVADLPKLLDFMVQTSSVSPSIKWIVSSRNRTDIERGLRLDGLRTRLSLELKENAEQVSRAVDVYIDHCISELAKIQYEISLRDQVRDVLQRKSNGTFLWVALVVQELKKAESFEVLDVINEVPAGLEDLYRRMIDQIQQLDRRKPELCRAILSAATTAYRPLHLAELAVLSSLPFDISSSYKSIQTIVNMCGSFLTIRDNIVYTIHQSAQDFLSTDASIFPSGIKDVHYTIFWRSLQIMSRTLQRDIYSLGAPGFSIDQVKQPSPDPLAAARYSCLYWVDHLLNCDATEETRNDLKDGGLVDKFLCQSYLYWLEALSLIRGLSSGIIMIKNLENKLKTNKSPDLYAFIHDAKRFVLYNRSVIDHTPLQLYCSALVFAPEKSIIRKQFEKCIPAWIQTKPKVQADWSAVLQTLEGHSGSVRSVAFSPDGKQIVSGSVDTTVRLWDTTTGAVLQTLEGHSGRVRSVAFSPEGQAVNTLLVAKDWIAEGGTNILWLPPDYRSPTSTAVWNEILALGYLSGKVFILGFKEGLKLI
ncbi:hypothetical protein B7463_g4094, partial [Scytalidium lignicola]